MRRSPFALLLWLVLLLAGCGGSQPDFVVADTPGVTRLSPGITLSASSDTTEYGESMTFTARVEGEAGVPTGSLAFLDGTTVLSPRLNLDADGEACFTISSLAIGAHPVTAAYSGDSAYTAGVSSPLTHTVVKASPDVDLSSSVNPTVFGQATTFTATVRGAPGLESVTGTVDFRDGTLVVASGVPLDAAGQATLTTSTLPTGQRTLTAVYSGDDNLESAQATFAQTVNPLTNGVSVGSSLNPSTFGQNVTLTAIVATTSGGAPTGTVDFLVDGMAVASGSVLDGGAAATFSTGSLSGGNHTVTVAYSGDSNHLAAVSLPLLQTVDKAEVEVALGSSVNPSLVGQSLNLTATVSVVSPGAGTPTGTLEFRDGLTVLASGISVDGQGQAQITTSTLAEGDRALTVSYSGDASFEAGEASFNQTVNRRVSGISLGSSANPSGFGQNVTFTATVTDTSGDIATGTVDFFADGVEIGSAELNTNATATLATASLALGNHNLTATYVGDVKFTGSTSATVTQVVSQAATTTTLTSSANPSISIQNVTVTATVVTAYGPAAGTVDFTFDGNITVSDAVLDANGQATFSLPAMRALGDYSVVASFDGNSNFAPSGPAAFTQVVEPSMFVSAFEGQITRASARFGTEPPFMGTLDVPSASQMSIVGSELFTGLFAAEAWVVDLTTSNSTPKRRLAGDLTTLSGRVLGSVVANDEWFLTNVGSNEVKVFDATADGNVAPKRTISASTLDTPWAMWVHGSELLVASLGNGHVLGFNVTSNGAVTPVRDLTGLVQPVALCVSGSELFVVGGPYGSVYIAVYDLATANGPATPKRRIQGSNTVMGNPTLGGQPTGVCIHQNQIYVAVQYRGVLVFDREADGNVAPLRVLPGSSIAGGERLTGITFGP